MKVEQLEHIYFIGIGGIGMSALARYFKQQGKEVSGYDRTETPLTKKMVSEGIDIFYSVNPKRLEANPDLVVFTPAIPDDHPELIRAREKGIPLMKRAEVLGLISYSSRTIAVAGTHGKTTTSTMIAHILSCSGLSCSAFLGGVAKNYDSNFLAGDSDWVVVEADEYDRSFLHLKPELAVITSVEPDHLDIYGDEQAVWNSGFRAFVGKIQAEGALWMHHSLLQQMGNENAGLRKYTYGISEGKCKAENTRVENGAFIFDYVDEQGSLDGIRLPMPGRHNVENATAAIAVARKLKCAGEDIREALDSFKGIKRRFERILDLPGRIFIDDYAHHPTEVKAAISACRELFPGKEIWGIFQPHLYSRTRDFADEFAEALDKLDKAVLLPVYPAREKPIKGVSSEMILEKMNNPRKEKWNKENALQKLKMNHPEVLITLGAGDIDQLIEPIKQLFLNE
jgi:UDP-N-acetylmuramate--alanine ligase